MPEYTAAQLLGQMFLSNLATASAEILFAYYIMYIGYENLVDKNKSRILSLQQILLALACAIALGRYISFYMLNYVVYDRKLAGEKIFDLSLALRYLIKAAKRKGKIVKTKRMQKKCVFYL